MKFGAGGGGKHCTFAVCIMPIDTSSVSVTEESYACLKEYVLGFKEKGRVIILGDFNVGVGRSTDVDDVNGMLVVTSLFLCESVIVDSECWSLSGLG